MKVLIPNKLYKDHTETYYSENKVITEDEALKILVAENIRLNKKLKNCSMFKIRERLEKGEEMQDRFKAELFNTPEDKQYLDYLEEHINNVKRVWGTLQDFLKGDFWLDDYDYHCINGLIQNHDNSKYNKDEFFPYRQKFYPIKNEAIGKDWFNQAWNIHQKSNKHHWQYWVMIEDSGKQIVLKMPFHFIAELLCDWTAMSVKFNNKPSDWYLKNKQKMILHEKTIKGIERWIPLFDKVFELLQGENKNERQ